MSTDWRIKGEEAAGCNCAWGCPCQFNANPTNGHCRGFAAWEIEEGHFGDTSLDGVRFGVMASWPGAIHEGNGTVQYLVDDGASDEQFEAVSALTTGAHGGGWFEIIAAVCPNARDPIKVPIELESDRERRVASFKFGDMLESRVEPIKNPVDGSEHRARIDLPNGFEYKFAEAASTAKARSSLEQPLDLEVEDTHAHLNQFDWAPA